MKTQHIILSCLLVCSTLLVNAQKYPFKSDDKATLKVWGECGMCKKKIEKSAISAGATAAEWNEDTKMLSFSYNNKKTTPVKIEQSIAAAGYDTKNITASQQAYNKLPECCHYERKDAAKQVSACCDKSSNCVKADGCCKGGECSKDHTACTESNSCKSGDCCKS